MQMRVCIDLVNEFTCSMCLTDFNYGNEEQICPRCTAKVCAGCRSSMLQYVGYHECITNSSVDEMLRSARCPICREKAPPCNVAEGVALLKALYKSVRACQDAITTRRGRPRLGAVTKVAVVDALQQCDELIFGAYDGCEWYTEIAHLSLRCAIMCVELLQA